ncbi:unnamed protein product [Schistosoma rodhaini]|uniref:Protein FAM47E n=1 Tax=Schistosoma rodhaini TaxID=6188 RepID=A0AA85G4A9_9TREM|nr:unnamed protein product [Schistosoma rodhaini]CAH8597686.1 unnamed protein product [Schistosoma rodhaini]
MGNTKKFKNNALKWKFLSFYALGSKCLDSSVQSVGPVIIDKEKNFKCSRDQYIKQHNNHNKNLPSKLDELESKLLSHPLLLFPYLLQYLPLSVSKTVIDLLDRPHKERLIDLIKIAKHQNIHENVQNKTGMKLSNPSNGGLIRDSKLNSSVSSVKSKVEDEDFIEPEMFIEYPSVKEEALAFCEFIKNLDGSSIDNPEPTTLASLFAGTHEAQPPVSTPINVVELINLPYELRHSVKEPPKLLCDKNSLTDSESLPRITKSNAAKKQEKNFERLHYGAWFIPPKQWKVIKDNGANTIHNKSEFDSVKTKSYKELMESLNGKMKETHGYDAFMEFIQNKNKRIPKFMKLQ